MSNSIRPWHERRRYLAATVCCLSLVAAGPWPRCLFESSVFRSWLDRENRSPTHKEDAADRPVNGPSELFAGAAVVDWTDIAGRVPLAGYGFRVFSPSSGATAADPLAVRALVLRNGTDKVVLVTADLLLFNRLLTCAVFKELEERGLDWRREQVFFGATHTHSAPGGYAGSFLESLAMGRPRPSLVAVLAKRIVGAIESADRRQRPAEFGAAKVELPANLVRNRTNPHDATNRWLDVLDVRQSDRHEPIASVVVASPHATCRRSKDFRVSSDYPGVLVREVETETGGVCLFLAGAVGSMAPPNDQVQRAELNDWLGKQLASHAIAAREGIGDYSRAIELTPIRSELALPPVQIKCSRNWRLSAVLGSLLCPHRTTLHGVGIGNRLLLGTPTDYSGVLALQLRDLVKDRVTIVTSFNGDYVGYALPESSYELSAYEPRHVSFYGATFGPALHDRLANLARTLPESAGSCLPQKTEGPAALGSPERQVH